MTQERLIHMDAASFADFVAALDGPGHGGARDDGVHVPVCAIANAHRIDAPATDSPLPFRALSAIAASLRAAGR